MSSDAPSLDGALSKIARAVEHRRFLTEALRPVLDEIRVSTVVQTAYDEDEQQFVVEVVYAPSIRPRLSTLAGDAIQNLRSALDHAVFEAIWLNEGEYWSKSQFPIVGRADDLKSGRKKTTLNKLGADFAAIVKRHQPFVDVNDYCVQGLAVDLPQAFKVRDANLPLAQLRELSNADKHRLLLPRYAWAKNSKFTPRRVKDCVPGEARFYQLEGGLIPGTPLARFDANLTGPNPEMEVDFDFTPGVGFGPYGDAEEVLGRLTEKVIRIVREFQQFF
jgi:hypothetical protein